MAPEQLGGAFANCLYEKWTCGGIIHGGSTASGYNPCVIL
jgi:hypothetical protein